MRIHARIGLSQMLLVAACTTLLSACSGGGPRSHEAQAAPPPGTDAKPAAVLTSVVAVLHPTVGSHASGVVYFSKVPAGIHVQARVEGLEPGSTHGFHIHAYGDCTAPDATSAGGHYDPFQTGHHGRPTDELKHGGDLGNLVANADGVATYDATVSNVSPGDGIGELLGLGVIVHADADHFDQPTGSAGARLACGVIGSANSSPPSATPGNEGGH